MSYDSIEMSNSKLRNTRAYIILINHIINYLHLNEPSLYIRMNFLTKFQIKKI
jgi:hypothetical protein